MCERPAPIAAAPGDVGEGDEGGAGAGDQATKAGRGGGTWRPREGDMGHRVEGWCGQSRHRTAVAGTGRARAWRVRNRDLMPVPHEVTDLKGAL
jgi:hypothetical protein